MGIFKNAGSFIGNTFKSGGLIDPAGGTIRAMGDQPTNFNTIVNPGRINDGVTAGPNEGGILGTPKLPPPFDPNAAGSIFNIGRPKGPLYDPSSMPAPGTPTNGLAGGSMSGGIDWAPIIARALRKS